MSLTAVVQKQADIRDWPDTTGPIYSGSKAGERRRPSDATLMGSLGEQQVGATTMDVSHLAGLDM